jgi:hypothetical protein
LVTGLKSENIWTCQDYHELFATQSVKNELKESLREHILLLFIIAYIYSVICSNGMAHSFSSDDDFVILYGVNHEQTGKAIINNASFYGEELFNGVAVAQISAQFENSAAEYFPEGYDNGKFYYACKFSRKEGGDSITVPYSTGNPDGKAYGIDNNKDAFIGYRLYVDKEALIGPAHMDVIWDRAILFTKKKGTDTLQGKNGRKDQSQYISLKIGSSEKAILI